MNHSAAIGRRVHWSAVLIAAAVATPIIYSWIVFAGPNSDTILTYHRNLLAHGFPGLLRILAEQDQAPLPQIIHYVFYGIGFSSVVALQAASSAAVVTVVLGALAWDLAADTTYRRLTDSQRTVVYALGAVAILLSPSFNASLTWVRYAVMIGVAWYAVWILEARLSAAEDREAQRRYAVLLGVILGLGPLISYTWGVVIVASLASMRRRSGISFRNIRGSLVLGSLPGLLTALVWLVYAGSAHLSLILLRTHATTGHVVKTLGKGLHLLMYPLTGYVLFPGLAGIIIIVACAATLGLSAWLFLQARRDLRAPFLCHLLIPIPLFVATSVSSGYGMIGPGLILTSCAIRGVLSSSRPRQVVLTALGLTALLGATVVNLQGLDAMGTGMAANKSRAAVQLVLSHLSQDDALNPHTLVLAGDESSRVLIEAIPAVGHRFIVETAPRTAPNIDALLRVGYPQDNLLPSTNRVVAVITDQPQTQFLDRWLGEEGFHLTSFQSEVGTYSKWMGRFTSVARPSQYLIEEWVR